MRRDPVERAVAEDLGWLPPLTALRRHWLPALVVAVLCLAVGIVAAGDRQTHYTAQARLLVGQATVSAQAEPGQANAVIQLAGTYSRIFPSDGVSAAVTSGLGPDRPNVVSTSASPVPESAIILVEAVATTPAAANRAADVGARALVRAVTALQSAPGTPAAYLKQYQQISVTLATAQTQQSQANEAVTALGTAPGVRATPAYQAAQLTATLARAKVAQLTLQAQAVGTSYQAAVQAPPAGGGLSLLAHARTTGDNAKSGKELYGGIGLALGLVLAVLLATLLGRRNVVRYLRDAEDEALREPVLDLQRDRVNGVRGQAQPSQQPAGS